METPANYNYAIPDPTWDYSTVYHDLQAIKSDLDGFIVWLSSHEDASPQLDKQAKDKLTTMINNLSELRDKF